MRRIVELNKGWKAFGIVVVLLLVIGGLFCAGVAIAAHCHNVGFIQEIQSWKPAVEPAVEGAKAIMKI